MVDGVWGIGCSRPATPEERVEQDHQSVLGGGIEDSDALWVKRIVAVQARVQFDAGESLRRQFGHHRFDTAQSGQAVRIKTGDRNEAIRMRACRLEDDLVVNVVRNGDETAR